MSNETMTVAGALDILAGTARHADSPLDKAIRVVAARLRGEAAQGEQQAVAFAHVYRAVAGADHASAQAPWNRQRGVVFGIGPAPHEGVDGGIQYLNLYTRPQPVAVARLTDAEIDARLNALHRGMRERGEHNGGMAGVAWDRAVFRAALSAAPAAPADAPMEMRICELRHVILRPNRAYVFTVDPNCEKCREVAQSGDYGNPAAPAPVAGDAVEVDAVPVSVLEQVLSEISANAKRHGDESRNKRWAEWLRSEHSSKAGAYHQAAHLIAVAIKTETVAALAQDRAQGEVIETNCTDCGTKVFAWPQNRDSSRCLGCVADAEDASQGAGVPEPVEDAIAVLQDFGRIDIVDAIREHYRAPKPADQGVR